jgi:hypothetical protein
MSLSTQQIAALTTSLSPVRMGTYLNATGFGASATAFDIYVWNAAVSAAIFSSLHICEVVVRNAISHALELKYGVDWPWDGRFERTLTRWGKGELASARQGISPGSPGKVIAELKFAFWGQLFKAGQDQHIWNSHLHTAFPNIPFPLTVATARKQLYDDMNALRGIRNRIAHHEPVFAYPLSEHLACIVRLLKFRCLETENWHSSWETASVVMAARP